MEEIVLSSKDGIITANSVDISNKFGKEHSKVKRTIKSFENDVANFGEMFYLSASVDKNANAHS